ncbi:MAG TPA: hypothetical protein PKB02_08145 [Anaerohalosphaeraceae bacterium]|nr:hypothetical protein [Anaerohalosphaeraceae bacterium]
MGKFVVRKITGFPSPPARGQALRGNDKVWYGVTMGDPQVARTRE